MEYKIPLKNKDKEIIGHALVSPEDYERVISLNAYICHGYPEVSYQLNTVRLSKFVFCILQGNVVPDGYVIDHENRNPLDNRRGNLRLLTYTQNAANRTKMDNASSKYYGVTFDITYQMFKAYI